MKRAKTVDSYIDEAEHWRAELTKLRAILKSTELTEEVRWGGPCHTFAGKNVVGLGPMIAAGKGLNDKYR